MRAPARELIPLPDGLSLVDAAASQVAFGTAWRALVVLAQMRAGQTVLILGGGGGVGSAAVQVAALRGARVLAVTRRPENGHLLRWLGAETVVSRAASEMIEQVREKTAGLGVDIVIDPVGGDYTVAALSLLAPDGRVIVCGAHTGEVVSIDLVKLFRNQSYIIGSRRAVRADLDHVLPLVVSGALRPVIDQIAPLSAASDIHRRMEAAGHTGKMVLVPERMADTYSSRISKRLA